MILTEKVKPKTRKGVHYESSTQVTSTPTSNFLILKHQLYCQMIHQNLLVEWDQGN